MASPQIGQAAEVLVGLPSSTATLASSSAMRFGSVVKVFQPGTASKSLSMSETESGANAMLPPHGKVVVTDNGLAAIVARLKLIAVVALPEGGRILRVRYGDMNLEYLLDAECARHLAGLLVSDGAA